MTMIRPLSLAVLAVGIFVGLLRATPSGQTPAAASEASAATGAAAADPVQRFLNHPDEKLTQYRAKRHLQARNPRFDKEGWLDAITELDPGQGFRYTIVAEDGSGLIRNRVLRRALEAEQQALAEGEVSRSAISPANYR